MRRLRRISVAVALVLAFSLTQACTSTAAFKATSAAVTAVDLAMHGWGEWVHAGKSTPEQRATVEKAYGAYQAAIDVAEKATFAYYANAEKDPKALRAIMEAVTQAGISVIVVVNSFRTGVPPIPVPTAGG